MIYAIHYKFYYTESLSADQFPWEASMKFENKIIVN